MHFSGAVIICLLLYHRVISSKCSLLEERISLQEENLLEKFFTETKLFWDENDTRVVTVIGASDDQLRQTKSLLEAFPHFIGKSVEKICSTTEFTSKSRLVYFTDSLEPEYLEKMATGFWQCGKKNKLYIIFEAEAPNVVIDIERVLRTCFDAAAQLPVIIHHTKKSLKLYGYVLTPNCTGKSELLVDWKPGVNGQRRIDWYGNFTYDGCPLSVGTRHRPPWLHLAEDAEGKKKIIGGSEGEVILTVAQKLNFTPLVQSFEPRDKIGAIVEREIICSCFAGNTSIGIAQIRPREKIRKFVDISFSYSQECIVWVIPGVRVWKHNIITAEFTPGTWFLVGLAFLVSFGLDKIVRTTRYLNRANANNKGCCSIVLDLIGSTLGNPIVYQPLSMGGKVLLMTYLFYSTVISTAYKSSLSSMFTADDGVPRIVDAAGIISANLTPGGDNIRLSILEDQLDGDEVVQELIKRYVIETNISRALRRISNDKNFAYLTSLTDLAYEIHLMKKTGERLSFDLIQRCELAYGNVFVFRRDSFLTHKINKIIGRFSEGGLVNYWTKDITKRSHMASRTSYSFDGETSPAELSDFSRQKFYYVFSVYCSALIVCILVFLGELLVHKFKIAERAMGLKIWKVFENGRRGRL